MESREFVFNMIRDERNRQDALHNWNHRTNRLSVLVEEVGEIASAIQGEGNLEEELIQLASVCIRWLEEFYD